MRNKYSKSNIYCIRERIKIIIDHEIMNLSMDIIKDNSNKGNIINNSKSRCRCKYRWSRVIKKGNKITTLITKITTI